MQMPCAARTRPVVRTRLVGELDLVSAARVAAHLAQVVHRGSRVLVDLSGVGFMDCAGLAPLVQADRKALSGGGWVRVHRVPAGPLRVLRLTGTAWLLAGPATR